MKTFVLFLFIIFQILCQDYYQLLGVPRSASDDQIKKAFKKLSLKYHPDKAKGNKEESEKQFQKIVNAYEILKDPEQRKIYDKFGEEGLKEHTQRQQQKQGHFNYNDVFSRFFGGGFQQQKPNLEQSLFSKSDVYEIDMTTINRFFRRDHVWLIFFYKNDDYGRQYKNTWNELASKYYGIFQVAAINCAAENEICDDEFQVYEFPKVFAYPANIRQEPVEFKLKMELDQLAKFAISFMESFVSIVTNDNYDNFIRQQDQHIVLLFTNKTSTPPLLKVLSKELKGKLVFGQVRNSDTKLIQQFQINNFPTLMVVTEPEQYRGVIYEQNDFKKDQIMKFLREYAYISKKVKKTHQAPRELSTLLIKSGSCTTKDTKMCFIIITEDKDYLDLLNPLSQHYMKDKIDFYYINKNNLIYSEVFDDINKFPTAVVIKPKKERYAQLQGELTLQTIQDFLDSIISGNVQFKPMKDSLDFNIFKEDL
ncbi:unnamed protein product [Paramecium sonneborni]|uniref:J domain-containing protein n=1 Tax=Paramecium sonneborni TaxID=65129 RepID=A0A8S1PX23_9CILI|nr:unnamed protein product [Paramecium sonneborni]